MAQSWGALSKAEPAFAQEVQSRFDQYTHKVLATLRRDGAPRVSGIEAEFKDGELWLGMMPGSAKAKDLQRDPRMAIHSGTEDPPKAPAPGTVFDAKIAGVAVEVHGDDDQQGPAGPGDAHRFRVQVTEAVLVVLGDTGDHLLIRIWTPSRGLREVKRY